MARKSKPKSKPAKKRPARQKPASREEITQPMPVLEAPSGNEATTQLPTYAVVDEIEEKMIIDEIDQISGR
jgi:hypothetical protein